MNNIPTSARLKNSMVTNACAYMQYENVNKTWTQNEENIFADCEATNCITSRSMFFI